MGNKPVIRSRAYCIPQEILLGVQSPRVSPTLLAQKPQAKVYFSYLHSPVLQKEGQQSPEIPFDGDRGPGWGIRVLQGWQLA